MSEKREIDHEYTDQIVCPYCGYKDDCSWDYDADSGRADCGRCEREFAYERNVSVSYTTKEVTP